MVRVSDVISPEEVGKWKDGDIITIKAGTGAGKSHFIKHIVYAHAKHKGKKILMLIHRKNCVDQFQAEIEKDKKTDVIDIVTYQSIEAKYKSKKIFDFSEYQYIVCDEFHYFMSDAAFNKYTDISLNRILEQTNKVRIFMSATGDHMKNYIRNYKKLETIDHEVPIEFNFIKSLTFFNKVDTLEAFMNEAIEKKEKGIFFIQSAKDAYELWNKYKDYALFNCSKNNKDGYYKYVDKEKINAMLKEEKFHDLILITTTCMDAGVNINDENVQHIVCDVTDIGTLVQCIGRKRLQNKNDGIHLHIKTITNQQLGGMKTQLNNKRAMAKFLMKHTVKEFIEKFSRKLDYSNIVYDDVVDEEDKGTKKVNDLMYFKCLTDLIEIEAMKKKGKFGYCKYLKELFGIDDYWLIEEKNEKDKLEKYLESIVGKKLYKEEQKELIEVFKANGLSARTLGINTMNGNLKDRELPFIINVGKRKSYRDEHGKVKKEKSHWIIGRITYV